MTQTAQRPVMHPGHEITVTPGPAFGRAHVDCTCGLTRVCASGYAANRVALIHHHDAGGCNCPEHVIADPVHPSPCTPQSPARILSRRPTST